MPNSARLPMHWQPQNPLGSTLQEAALGLASAPTSAFNPLDDSANGNYAQMSSSMPLGQNMQNGLKTGAMPSPYGPPGVAGGMMGNAEPLIGQPIQHGLDNTQGLQGMGAGMPQAMGNGLGMYGQGAQSQGQMQVPWGGQVGLQPGEGVGAYWNTLIDGESCLYCMNDEEANVQVSWGRGCEYVSDDSYSTLIWHACSFRLCWNILTTVMRDQSAA